MKVITRVSCFLLAVLILSGCSHPSTEVATPPPPTAEDLQIARQAIAPADISLLLRSGYKQDAIIAEIQKKRLSAPPDGATEDSLVRSGASPALIAAMKAEKNLLSPSQRQAFDNFAAEKMQRVQQEASSRQQAAFAAQQAENEERQRRAAALQQTLHNARVADNNEKAREQAWENYKRQKEYLEKRIASLQSNMNQRRSYGARENNLVEANQELERLNEQLRNLPTPALR